MNQADFLALTERFYQTSFTLTDVERLIGPIREHRGGTVFLTPRSNTSYSAAEIEVLEQTAGGQPFAASMDLVLKDAVVLDFDLLTQRFGPPKEGPIAHPGDPTPYRFLVTERYDLDGFFELFVPGAGAAGRNSVVRIILSRFTPQATEAGRRLRAIQAKLSKRK